MCFTAAVQFGQAATNQKTRSPSFFFFFTHPKMVITLQAGQELHQFFRRLLSFGTCRRLRLRTVSWDTVCPPLCSHYISTVYCYQPNAGPFFTAVVQLHSGPEFTYLMLKRRLKSIAQSCQRHFVHRALRLYVFLCNRLNNRCRVTCAWFLARRFQSTGLKMTLPCKLSKQ